MADDLVVKMKRSKELFKKIESLELDNITEITNKLSDASKAKFYDDIKHLSDDELKLLNNNTEFLDEWQNIEKMENATKKQKLPEWLQKIKEGNEFNKMRAKHYPYNEIYLEKPEGVGGKGKYVILDSYDPAKGEIVSRKFTQFDEITEQTGLNYLREFKNKYPPKTKIAQVDSNINGANKGLKEVKQIEGEMILEIPVQKSGKIPQSILDYANENFIKIRDINGKIYNQNGS